MNKLIIIGNGFDLHHYLPTSYGSFIKWLIKQNFEKVLAYEQGDDEFFEITKGDPHDPEASPDYPPMNEAAGHLLQNQETVIRKSFQKFNCKLSPKGTFATQIIENMRTSYWVDIELEYFRQLTVILKNYNHKDLLCD